MRTVCAWCEEPSRAWRPGAPGDELTHGICETHHRRLLSERQREVRVKVLIIDDDVGSVEEYSAFLQAIGYEVECARHAGDGLMLIECGRPDLVILRTRVDGLDGLEVLGRIRTLDATLPVVVVGIDDDPAPGIDVQSVNDCRYLAKPSDAGGLDRLIVEAVAALTPP